jgi:hypothetical protein
MYLQLGLVAVMAVVGQRVMAIRGAGAVYLLPFYSESVHHMTDTSPSSGSPLILQVGS